MFLAHLVCQAVDLVGDLTQRHSDLSVLLSSLHHHHWHTHVRWVWCWNQTNHIISHNASLLAQCFRWT